MIADGERDGLLDHHGDFDRDGCRLLLVGAERAFLVWLDAVGLRVVVVLPLVVSGMGHFTRTAMFATMVPPFFPYRTQLVLVSGAMELAGAVGLLLPHSPVRLRFVLRAS